MNETNQSTTLSNLTHEEAILRATSLIPKIRERASMSEELRMQPKDTIQDFIDSGLIRILSPKRWGGHELPFDTLFRTGTEIAKADPSAAWCFVLLAIHSWVLAYFPEKAQQEVLGRRSRCMYIIFFSTTPNNKAERVEGGFIVNGEWGNSSGVDHCDYAMIMATVFPKTPEEKVEYYMMLVPKRNYEILHKWKTIAQRELEAITFS